MAKSGAVFGIIGILLGIGGLGFGVVNWMNQPTIPYEPQWYSYRSSEFYPNPAMIYFPIPSIAIEFELGAPMAIHLLFTCSARCYADPVSFSDLFFYFMINDVQQLTMPWARVGSHEGTSDSDYYSVSLQHNIDLLTPGVYNITVVVLTERVGNFIRQSSLLIQSHIA
ncbi:MAG: hypothetical protein ACW986_19200 [Promethearchaeota archaeon]|jgi:hypothetical protein